jgi:hypothetical protein
MFTLFGFVTSLGSQLCYARTMKGRYTTELHNVVIRIQLDVSGSYIARIQNNFLGFVTLIFLCLYHSPFRIIPAGGFILKTSEEVSVTLKQNNEKVLVAFLIK